MKLIQIKQNTTNQNVLIWIEEYIQSLDHDIESSKDSEEREF